MTPSELEAKVRSPMDEIVAQQGSRGSTSCSAKVRRAEFIEIQPRLADQHRPHPQVALGAAS
jgi:predicted Co/Zn/Cd cation transporter (cation efflux family)